jgi:hypothetical protein
MNAKARPETKTTEPEATPTPNFTVQQIENRLVAVLTSALQARGGSVHSFAEWTLAGHGIVLVLSTGQEFWLTLAEASF